MVNGLSVDVEDYFHVSAFDKHISPSAWDQHESRVEANTIKLLDLFDGMQARATFFTLGWVAERNPELVKEIHARGHEVASHGYRHKMVTRMSPDEFRDDVTKTKDILEQITGEPVTGFRAASFSIVPDSLWAMEILEQVGYRYDSSMFPVRHDRYGMRGIPLAPHRWPGSDLVEVPMSVLPLFGYPVGVGGGGYLRQFPYRFTRWAVGRIHQENRPVVTYLHPWEIDPEQPVQQVGALTRLRHYRGLGGCENKVKKLLADFRFAPIRTLADQVRNGGA